MQIQSKYTFALSRAHKYVVCCMTYTEQECDSELIIAIGRS